MRAFRFRLATLKRLREQARELAQRELGRAEQRRSEVDVQNQQVKTEFGELEIHMRKAMNRKQVDVDRVMDGHRHQLSLEAHLAELDRAMTEANQEVARCRSKLIEADREVKVLEKLHERQLAEHARQITQHEAKQLDEVATTRALRQTLS
jgi:flagellar FliJ protein